jgi:hypothetical protein
MLDLNELVRFRVACGPSLRVELASVVKKFSIGKGGTRRTCWPDCYNYYKLGSFTNLGRGEM